MVNLINMFASDCDNTTPFNHTTRFKFSRAISIDLNWTLATIIFLSANAFGLYRLFLGVNFFDEPFYAALPFRFLHGQKLFVQDFTLAQTFAIPIYPWVKIHSLIFQGTDYLILFLRCCHWGVNLGLELILFYLIKKELPSSIALIIVSSVGLFLPGNIPTLSYNTLGTLFLTFGLFTSFFAFYSKKQYFYFISGLSLGLCSLTYVTFISIALLVSLQIALLSRSKKAFALYASGILIVLVWPTLLLANRLDAFQSSLALSKEYGYSANKLITLIDLAHKLFPKSVLGTTILFSLSYLFCLKTKSPIRFALILLIPVMTFILCQLSTLYWPVYPFYLSVLGLIPLIKTPRSTFIDGLLKWVFIPSMLAGLVAGLTSALGALNAQVGLLPAFLVSVIFIYSAMTTAPRSFSRLSPIFLGLPVILALLSPINMWDESPTNQLTEIVSQGPYHGLYTSTEKRRYLESVSTELLSSISSKGPLLIYPNFTAGYLIAGVPPASGLLWYQNPKGGVDHYLAEAYKKEMTPDSKILRMKYWYATPTLKLTNFFDPKSPINKIIETQHHPIKDTKWFTLYAPLKSQLLNYK